jgi:signal recognition particle subunit SRP54
VNNLVDRFSAAQKMMKQMRNGGGMPAGMPNMGGMSGLSGLPGIPKAIKTQPVKKKSRSGNPAKRAAEEI